MRILILSLIAVRCFAGYSYCVPLTLTAATGSTQTNFTEAFKGNNTIFKAVGSGGAVQHTSTRVGQTVPDDFVFTNDSTCTTVTGSYKWGFEDGGTADGTPVGWILISSLTTSGGTVYVAVGNASVSTYQGGAQGAEFDANTVAVYHLANGTTLNLQDSSAAAKDLTGTGTPTATTGQIDGAMSVNGTTQYTAITTPVTTVINNLTMSAWLNLPADPGTLDYGIFYNGSNAANNGYGFENYFGQFAILYGGVFRQLSLGSFPTSTWTHVAFTITSGVSQFYDNGAANGATWSNTPVTPTAETGVAVNPTYGFMNFAQGLMDEAKISNVSRSANWIATEYANQSSVPSFGSPVLIPNLIRHRVQ